MTKLNDWMRTLRTVMIALAISCLAAGGLTSAQGLDDDGPGREMRPPRPPPTEGGQRPQHGPGAIMRELGEDFKRRNPEEYERLTKLREEDPEAFRDTMRERMRERLGDRLEAQENPLEKKIDELLAKYRAAEGEDKETCKSEIAEAIEKAFDARLAAQEEMVAKMARRLAQLRGRLEERRKLRKDICEQRLEELTKDPRLSW